MLAAQEDDLKGNPPAQEVINMQDSMEKIRNQEFKEKLVKGEDYPEDKFDQKDD